MRTTVLWGVTAALVSGVLLVTGGQTAERPLMRDLELEALQEAVRWPKPDVSTVLALVGRFVAAGRDQEGYAYFQERTRDAPDRPLFLALEGFFQARVAGDVFLLRRTGWVNAAVAKLNGAVARDPGVPRYFRGLVLAELPARFEMSHHGGDGSAVGPRQQGPLPRRPPAQRLPGPRARVHDTWPRGRGQGGARTLGLRVARSQPADLHHGLLGERQGRLPLSPAPARRDGPGRLRRPGIRFRRHRLRPHG